jgi:hypothetical protein
MQSDVTEIAIVIVTTAGTVLGGTSIWKYLETRAREKVKQAQENRKDENLYRDDLRERVAILESKLERADKEKHDLQQEMLKMIEKIATLSVEVEVLRRENTDLRRRISHEDVNS